MEMQDADRRLIEWEARGMDSCCCGCCCCDRGEAGLHPQDTLIQLLRHKEIQLRRMAQFFAATLLLLLVGVLALLLMVGLGERCVPSPTVQTKEENRISPPDASIKPESSSRQSDQVKPSALLTVPAGEKKHNGKYLLWESDESKAHRSGGFTYNETEGDLVVPKEGFYRVFLQITYQGNKTQCFEKKLLIKVFRISNEYNRNDHLLSAVDTPNCSAETWSKSVYTSAVFKLTANSRLRVTATHPELIAHNEQEVFFGAELI